METDERKLTGMGHQRPDDPDMREAARCAAAQRQPDHRPADTAEPYLVVAVGALLAAAHPVVQHHKLSCRDQHIRRDVPESYIELT